MKDSEIVSQIHYVVADYLQIDDRKLTKFVVSVLAAPPDRKPNIIFDVTLKNIEKLYKLSYQVKQLGYDLDKIHIVWVVNDIQVALKQNAERSRVVHPHILMDTHRGAGNTMHDIANMGKKLQKVMDGAIIFAFNKVGVDTSLVKSSGPEAKGVKSRGLRGIAPELPSGYQNTKPNTRSGRGQYIKDANFFYVKHPRKRPLSVEEISKDIRRRIATYVPKNLKWD